MPYAQLGPLEENSPGPAARAAGKTVSCAVTAKTATAYTSTCLVYGGRELIRNGVVAVLRLHIAPDAQPGQFTIQVAQPLAVTLDATRVPMEKTETVVTIKKK